MSARLDLEANQECLPLQWNHIIVLYNTVALKEIDLLSRYNIK
jgi:hypothetical protein